ncbi:META domain-containing protein [Helicobacter anatolicus]|uniref:META domain-containing protein n=1 Tax=Helicobacter anatolicus TaxID=2905874 RepID=UPI001E5C1B26|nr:META domain-containing protein [Helicobacter anatolicus]MCE3039223.1 META domain-containing protein [Helicobacter anatolicus]
MSRFLPFFAVFVVIFSGCSLLNIFQGNFDRNEWELEKIVVENKEYKGLRGMKNKALEMLNTKDSENKDLNVLDTKEEQQEKKSSLKGEKFDDESFAPYEGQTPIGVGELQELAQNDNISTWSFDPTQNKIYGIAGCNHYSADYTWRDADNIEIYGVNVTRKLCTPFVVMNFEIRFSRLLKGVFFVEKKGKNAMILRNQDVMIYLKSK